MVQTGPLKARAPALADVQAEPPTPVPLRWFGSSGIRGPLERVDTALAMRLGRAVGTRFGRVVVGRDARLSGPALYNALVAGLLSQGTQVTDLGVVPTPVLARATRVYDAGIQVTASHNPAPDNGFKLWTPTGSAPTEAALRDIEVDMQAAPTEAAWDAVGRLDHDPGARQRYMDDARRHLLVETHRPLAGLRIALDCAHGAGATTTPELLASLGADLTVLGGNPDGRFPDHPSEPTAANLARLSTLMAAGDFAFGLAHDGDADRTVVLGPDGKILAQERLFAILAQARGDQVVALPIDASGVVRDHLPEAEILITPVGDIHLSRAIEQGATFACEPSGPWFIGEWSPTPEGPFAAAYIACALAADLGILRRAAALPTYARVMHKVRLPQHIAREKAVQLIDQLAESLAVTLAATSVSRVDGVRVDTADGWALLRPSGTEPVVRITAEAKSDGRAAALAESTRMSFEAALGGC